MEPVRHPALSLHHKPFLSSAPRLNRRLKLPRFRWKLRHSSIFTIRIAPTDMLESDPGGVFDPGSEVHSRIPPIHKDSFEFYPTLLSCLEQRFSSSPFVSVGGTYMAVQQVAEGIGE